MKNLLFILVAATQLFSCQEKPKEKSEPTPIYADAFYEPDFIPYLMLKHNIDTINEIILKGPLQYLGTKIELNELFAIHEFNRFHFKYKYGSIIPGDIKLWFKDSLIKTNCYKIDGCFKYGYNFFNDTVIKFIEDAQYRIDENDSIIKFRKHSDISVDSINGEHYVFKGGNLVLYNNGLKTLFSYDSKQRLSTSYRAFISYGKYSGYEKKEYTYINDSCFSVKKSIKTRSVSNPSVVISYFENFLPVLKNNYSTSDTIVSSIKYEIIRNKEK